MPDSLTPVDKRMTYKRWPLANRIFHWSLVFGFLAMWWTGENSRFDWHVPIGYFMVGLIAFRLVYGVIGPTHGRLIKFVVGPKTLWHYIKTLNPKRYVHHMGHNPLGGLSVLGLLGGLSFLVATGMFAANTDGGQSGSPSRFVDYETSYQLAELHHIGFNIVLMLVGLHLAALVFYAVYLRINLVGAMVTGRKSIEPSQGIDRTQTPDAGQAAWRLALSLGFGAGVVVLLFMI